MKRLFFIIAMSFPTLLIAQESFTINGKVGYNNAGFAYLTYKINDQPKTDTAAVKNGAFVFTGKVPKIVGANIEVRYYAAPGFTNVADNLGFYLENKVITISSSTYVKNSRITGSPFNDEFQKLKEYIAQEKPASSIATGKAYEKYALNNLNSLIGLVALSNSLVRDADETVTQSILDQFPAELKNSTLAKNIQTTINAFKNTRPGHMAMSFTQNNPDGMPVSLSDFKGKYVLIDFWASWCIPCRNENPNLVNTYNLFKNKNFTVLGVSLDRIKENWLKAIKDDRLNWAQVSDLLYWDNAVAKMYAIKGVPTNILVDPRGKIVAKNLFGDQLKQRLTELLAAN